MTDHDNELKYKIWISRIPGIGCAIAGKLIAGVGSVGGVFFEKKSRLMKIPGIGEWCASRILESKSLDEADEEIDFIRKYHLETYFFTDTNYSKRLRQCSDAPILLYAKGNVNYNKSKIISVVGTRMATHRGKQLCQQLISQLKERGHNPIIVSGLAFGIDIFSHKAALENGLETVAVLGHGMDKIYPTVHTEVARDISHKGALLTEFPSYSKMDRVNFLRRNRIIAGLSDATIVVESAVKGGALVTADIANSYSRDVLAFPGRPSDAYAAGCNWLIKTNRAALIENVGDLEYFLGWNPENKEKYVVQAEIFEGLNEEELRICKLLKDHGETQIDVLAQKLRKPVSQLSVSLLNLEFSGLIKCLPGKVFTLKK